MPRPTRRYFLVFTHAATGKQIRTYTVGNTPCAARNMGWGQLEKLKSVDPDLPQDNGWALTTQNDEGIIGVR